MFTSITSRIPIAPVRRRGAIGSVFGTQPTSSGSSSLLDLQVAGSSKFTVAKNGDVGNVASISFSASPGLTSATNLNQYGVVLGSTAIISWRSGGNGTTSDVYLFRDSASVLAQRTGTAAQTFRVYNTYTDASNYERAKLAWSSNELLIGTEKAGTGTARPLKIQTDGSTRTGITAAGSVYIGSGAAALATTATDGFLYLPTCAGVPTGAPSAITGTQPVVVNSSTNQLYIYSGSAWSAISGSGGAAARTVLSDTVSSTTYIGWATSGSATSASVWKIWKTVYTSAGAISSNLSATNVAWDNRYTATYA